MGRKLNARERIAAFIPEYASYLLNHLLVGEDGKVPYQRSRGKRKQILGAEFGEKLLYKVKRGDKKAKMEAKWELGIFVGVRRRSHEAMIMTQDGLTRARSLKRIPEEKRWSEDCVNWVNWVPWHRYKDDETADGYVPEGVPEDEKLPSAQPCTKVLTNAFDRKAQFTINGCALPRQMHILK